MNDNELSTMVRESVTDVHSATPIAQIISRGRAVRARRRTPALAGAGAMLAGTALAVTTLVPSGHPGVEGSRHPGNPLANARLAAWQVAKQANGDIDVTIRQLKNPAGLQSTLRADGVPVNVSFTGHSLTASCHLYPTGIDVLNAVADFPGRGSNTAGGTVFLVIKPSALPTGAGLAIFVGGQDDISISMPPEPPGTAGGISEGVFGTSNDGLRTVVGVTVSPVYASQQCTG